MNNDINDVPVAQPCSVLSLTLKANRLKDRDVLSKSDPICIVYELVGRTQGRTQWQERGRTETIKNCLNPEWATQIQLNYFFEERQSLKFEIYDIDKPRESLSSQDFLGRCECELAEIIGDGGKKTLKLRFARNDTNAALPTEHHLPGQAADSGLPGNCGALTVFADELDEGAKEFAQFWVKGEKLDKKDFFDKSDPFLNIYRMLDSTNRQLAHRTEVIKRNLNPEWKVFEINVKQLCGGDLNKDFLIECFDYDNDRESKHDFIGSTATSLNKLVTKEVTRLPLINEKKRLKKGSKYKHSGELIFKSVQVLKQATFLDFINGGTQLDFAVAVDFTASNGRVTCSDSLHYINPHQPNQYEIGLRAVIDICQHYNNSKKFDVFGFGAKVPPQNIVSPIFSLTLDQNPSVVGVSGIMQAYRNSLHRVQLFGPTNFSPIIREVASKASRLANNGSRYQILLILTDGIISDMHETKQAIIEISSLPLSIIIIGVGNDSFDSMVELDSDDHLITHEGRTAQRDIVQFVPLRNFLSLNGQHVDSERAMALLAKEVLAEIPLQLTSFMKSRNILPRPPNDPWPRDPPAEIPPEPAFAQPPPLYPGTAPQPDTTQINQMPYPTHPMQPAQGHPYAYGQQSGNSSYGDGYNQQGPTPYPQPYPSTTPPYQQMAQMTLQTNTNPGYPSAPPSY